MATIVAEALLSASVELLLEKIISGEFVDFFRRTKLDKSLLEKLKTTLLSLQAVLNDAEEKQITNPAVKEWLDDLRHVVFEAEDLFDEINTEALRCKVKAEHQGQSLRAKVRNNLSSRFKRFYWGINSKMQALFERLENFAQKVPILDLKKGVSGSVWHGTPTSSVVDESSICGRDDDEKKLKEYLLSEDTGDGGSNIGVVSIVGMGGLGKTTLAKLLYNDPEVEKKFHLKAWAHISKDFDVCRFTKTLLESVTSKKPDVDDLNTLQVQLQQSLRHKKFLLVLDDIWKASYVSWNNLRVIFNSGNMGSKIIITTRDESVARDMQTSFIYRLPPLLSEDCWSLLAKHAFGENNCSKQSNLEAIGREIANKCDGLPLAAVALGGLLHKKLSPDHWNHVLKSNIWDLPDVEVQPALLLSYHYLPAHLKQCFSYCSIFPKNYVLEKNMVVQLWIAEGLVHQSKSQKSMEKVGEEYFDELVSRSMIQQHSVDGEKTFEMHDLLHDLATMVSSPYYMRLDEQKGHVSLERVRHLSYNRGEYDSHCNCKFDTILHGAKGLRTFLPLQYCWGYLSNMVVGDLLPRMKKLRVLSLSDYHNFTELPKSIGNLIYLRYLDLSHTYIERLPSETCKLYNLQTLLLSGCWKLLELPTDIGKLVNLRHLDISGTDVKEMPIQIAKLQNLQTLSDFVVSKQHDGLNVAELGKFHHLQGKLSISGLQNITDPSDASRANLKKNEQIDDLELKWDRIGAQQGSEIQSLVLERLWPSTSLKNLNIKGYGGTSFPNWLGDSAFGNMMSLHISNCGSCSLLPPLGQLHSLKGLHIEGMKSVKSVGGEFYGSSNSPSFQPFPSLETLTFYDMPEWEEWKTTGDTAAEFPSLKRLSLKECPKLKEITFCNLPSLIELKLRRCHQLVESGQHLDDNNNVTRRPSSDGFNQLKLPPLNSLQKLTIEDFPSLTSFPRDGLPKTLQSLTIKDCQNLDFLPLESLHKYTSLEVLQIRSSCNPMTSFSLGSLPVLKSLDLEKCNGLKSILIVEDASLQSLSFLTSIDIGNCDELESFTLGGLPIPNLIRLGVRQCEKLHSLPELMITFPSLENLRLDNLPNLQSFGKEGLPINLRRLTVGVVGGITELGLERLTCLTWLDIVGDDMVNAPMRTERPLLPTSLVTLHISDLHEIECLDGKWLHRLTSLQVLYVQDAPKLKSLPEEGLPSSLSRLTIWNCTNLESLPEEGLPSSLSVLTIKECPKLESLPEEGLPSSLSKLYIWDCPKLKSLPEKGLPSSLSLLNIWNCPLLEASLRRRKRGKEWHKVAHIPFIKIDDKFFT